MRAPYYAGYQCFQGLRELLPAWVIFFRVRPLDLPATGTCIFLFRHIAQGGTAMERPLTVGQLARATGVPAKTIRYYEQVGVLPVPRRSDAGYRRYSRHDVHRLLFIRRARALGLSR